MSAHKFFWSMIHSAWKCEQCGHVVEDRWFNLHSRAELPACVFKSLEPEVMQ